MNVQTTGRGSYLITVRRSELESLGVPAQEITGAEVKRLLEELLPRDENRARRLYVEVYPGKDELLIFAAFGGGVTQVYEFSELEDLLSAVKLCPRMLGSELLWDGAVYILVLTPGYGDSVPASIGEFGRRLKAGEELIPHLREQFGRLIPCGAVERLSAAF